MVYVLLVPGFEEIEALAPVDVLRRGGLSVRTVGVCGKEVMGAHGVVVTADILLDDVNPVEMELLVLPGGPGHTELIEAKALIDDAAKKHVPIGAICAAPAVLGKLGYLKGYRAVAYPGYEKYLEGATVLFDSVVTDDNITTARGAGVSVAFGLRLLEVLKGSDAAVKVSEAMQCNN